MKHCRILHVIFRMKTGGTECMLIDIMSLQARMGHEVELLIVNSGSDPAMLARIPSAVKVVEIGRREGTRSIGKVLRANAAAAAFRPDVVHVHNKRIVNLLMLPGLRRRMVQTLHTTGIELTGPQLRTGFTAISRAVADDARARLGISPEVVVNGIDTASIAVQPAPAPQARKLVCVGRLDTAVKGQDIAVSALADPRLAPLTLTLIGDGPDRAALRLLARELGVEQRVTFAGDMPRSEIYASLAGFDIFILPSRTEGFGLALAEGMAAALPAITADLPGPLEITDGSRCGVPFAAGSHTALADAVARVAALPAADRRALAQAGRERVVGHFSITSTVKAYLHAYQRLIPSLSRK